MGANLRIGLRNFHDDATLYTELDVVPGFAIENTQNDIRSRVWRSAGQDDQYILGTYDDGLTRTVNSFWMYLHQCYGGMIRLELFSDLNWTTSVFDSGYNAVINIVPTDGVDWGIDPFGLGSNDPFLTEAPYWLYFSPVAHLSYKISFAGFTTLFGYLAWQVSRFVLTNYYEVPRDPAFGATLGFVDQTEANRSRGGSLRTNRGAIWKTMVMDLQGMREAERAPWLDIMRYLGTGRSFPFSLFPEDGTRLERDHVILAKFISLDAINRPVKVLTKKLQLQEV